MSIYRYRDSGVDQHAVASHNAETITAGAGNDGVEVDGDWIDRTVKTQKGLALSGKLVIQYNSIMVGAETLTIAANLQDADDAAGLNAADYGDPFVSQVVATSSGSPIAGVVELDVDLSAARGFISDQITVTLSAAGVDTVSVSAVLVLGGYNNSPAP